MAPLNLGRAVASAAASAAPRTTTTTIAASSGCFGCLRRVSAAPSALPAAPSALPATPFSLTQSRGMKSGMSKAELEDLQGIPVRLLHDLPGFGRKHAIIRVKRGRMRNVWFPYGKAEYMTKQRFQEMGLTEASIGTRDRNFGLKSVLDKGKEKETPAVAAAAAVKKDLTLSPDETRDLLHNLLQPTLTFFRKPIASPAPAPAPEPVAPRSPSLAANAGDSQTHRAEAAEARALEAKAIFGSVSSADVLALVKETLVAADPENRVALEAASITILNLAPGEDRVKRLGTYDVEIVPGKGLDPVRRSIEVVPEQ